VSPLRHLADLSVVGHDPSRSDIGRVCPLTITIR